MGVPLMEIVPRFAKTEDLRAKEEFWLGESLFIDGYNTDDAPLRQAYFHR